MFARITTIQCDPARLEEAIAKLEALRPEIKKLPGIVDVYGAWRDDGHAVVTSIYRTRRAALAAAPRALMIFGGLAEYLNSTPRTDTYDNVAHLTE
jgi:hypothetical protein